MGMLLPRARTRAVVPSPVRRALQASGCERQVQIELPACADAALGNHRLRQKWILELPAFQYRIAHLQWTLCAPGWRPTEPPYRASSPPNRYPLGGELPHDIKRAGVKLNRQITTM
jgi:hypothetical protein